MENSTNTFIVNLSAVIAGVLSAFLCVFLLLSLFMSTGIDVWTDGGTQEEIQQAQVTINISTIVFGSISALVAGFVTKHLSAGKDILPLTVTGIILIAILLLLSDFTVVPATGILLPLLLPITFAGAWLRRKLSLKIKNNNE